MRVALFMDGRNFYGGWRSAERPRVHFPRLSQWLVRAVGADTLWGAHYYTAVETGEAAESHPQEALRAYLEMLETQPGYFVHRFARRTTSARCAQCGGETRFGVDTAVATAMVADMVRLAAIDAYDVCVLVAGDGDHTPALEAVRELGKQAHIASWGKVGVSRRYRHAAYDHIDLLDGLAEFTEPGEAGPPDVTAEPSEAELVEIFVDELRRAERKFDSGYVGLNYFLTGWKSDRLDPAPAVRRRVLDDAIAAARVEIYDTPTGARAIRSL